MTQLKLGIILSQSSTESSSALTFSSPITSLITVFTLSLSKLSPSDKFLHNCFLFCANPTLANLKNCSSSPLSCRACPGKERGAGVRWEQPHSQDRRVNLRRRPKISFCDKIHNFRLAIILY